MGAWFLSILLMGLFSILCGFIVYGITCFAIDRDEDLGETSGFLSAGTTAILSVFFILFSMMNSCTSTYTTYKESITDSLPYYFLVAGIIAIFFVVYFFIKNKQKIDEKNQEDAQCIQEYGMTKEEYDEKIREDKIREQKEKEEREKEFLNSLSSEYGEKSASFWFYKSRYDDNKLEANVYEDKKMIIVYSPTELNIVDSILFSSILDFSIDEDVQTIGGNSAKTTTKISTGSMVKRGLVGGVLLGGVGALAGAATAKKSSQTVFDEKKVERRYTISVNLDSISSPIYTLYFGFRTSACKEVAGMLTAIIRRNGIG